MCLCVYVYVCVCVRVSMCLCVCVRVLAVNELTLGHPPIGHCVRRFENPFSPFLLPKINTKWAFMLIWQLLVVYVCLVSSTLVKINTHTHTLTHTYTHTHTHTRLVEKKKKFSAGLFFFKEKKKVLRCLKIKKSFEARKVCQSLLGFWVQWVQRIPCIILFHLHCNFPTKLKSNMKKKIHDVFGFFTESRFLHQSR